MPAYLYPAAVALVVGVVVLLGWIAWLIFNWHVFKLSDHKVEAFDRTAQLAAAYLQPLRRQIAGRGDREPQTKPAPGSPLPTSTDDTRPIAN